MFFLPPSSFALARERSLRRNLHRLERRKRSRFLHLSRVYVSLKIRLNQSNHLHVHTNHILVYHGNNSRAFFSASALASFAASMCTSRLCLFVVLVWGVLVRKEPRAGSFGRWRPPAGDDILLIRASFLCDADDTKILNYTRRRLKAFIIIL